MEKIYRIRITDYAQEQMQEIQEYIAVTLRAPDTAVKWRKNMQRELASLSRFPARIPLTEEEPWHSEEIHKMVVGKYLVFFLIKEISCEVWITAVVYGSRNQRQQLSEILFRD